MIFWTWRVANELNNAENRTIFKVDAWRKSFFLLLVFAVVNIVFAIRADNPLLFIVTVLCLFGFFIYIQITIGNYVKSKDIDKSHLLRKLKVKGIVWIVHDSYEQ